MKAIVRNVLVCSSMSTHFVDELGNDSVLNEPFEAWVSLLQSDREQIRRAVKKKIEEIRLTYA